MTMADDTKAGEWKSGLPDDLKTHPALQDVKDVAGLAKRFVDTQAYVGSSIRPPGPDATPEQKVDFIRKLQEKVPEVLFLPDGDDEPAKISRETAWTKLGRPREEKGYQPPADVQLSEQHLEALRKEAMNDGLTVSQFQTRAKRVAQALAESELAQKTSLQALRKELGQAFDERTASVAAIAAKLGFSQELVAALKSGQVDQATFKAFSAIAKGFGGAREVGDQAGAMSGKLTPAEAAAQRAEIMADPVYFNPKPNQMAIHQVKVAKVQELNEIIAGAQ